MKTDAIKSTVSVSNKPASPAGFNAKEFLLVFLAALLIGFLYVGPSLIIKREFEERGHDFVLAQYKTYRDSLQAYLPRAREIYDGHFPPAELYGFTQATTIQNLLPSTLFSAFIFLFQGDVDLAYLGVQFVFSGVIFVLFYGLGRILFRSITWSFFFSVVAVLSSIPLRLPFYKWSGWAEFQAFFLNTFFPFVRTQFDQLYLARVDEPLLTYPFYLAAILTFFVFWQRPSLASGLGAGLSAGLLAYVYFHHWVYWSTALGVFFFLIAVIPKIRYRLKFYLVLILSAGVTTIPYLWQYLSFRRTDAYQDFILRAGVAFGRVVGVVRENIPDYIAYFLLALVVYLVYGRRQRERLFLFLGLIVAMLVVWNIQLVMGYSPVPHFFRRSISPVLFIIVFDLVREIFNVFRERSFTIQKFQNVLVIVVIGLSMFVVVKKVVNIVSINCCIQEHIMKYYEFPTSVKESWLWINTSLERDGVMISPSTLTSFYLNTHTAIRPFLPTAFITFFRTTELERRYLLAHRFFDVKKDILKQRLAGKLETGCSGYKCFPDKSSNLNDSVGNLYGNYFASRFGSFAGFAGQSKSVQEKIYEKRSERVGDLLERYNDSGLELGEVGISYVYVGPLEQQISPIDFTGRDNLKLVYRNPQVWIYKIVP